MPFLLPMVLGFIFTILITPLVRQGAVSIGLVDQPSARRINRVPIPTGGGIALYLGFFLAGYLMDVPNLLPLFISGTVVVVVGLVDDYYQLPAGYKFIGQLVAVMIYVIAGAQIQFVTNPFGGMIYLGMWSVPVTMLWMLALINVMNFIDGSDGLATGITIIAGLALLSIAMDLGRQPQVLAAGLLVGCALGFLPFNFSPARMFLGDAGSMFVGFLLAALSTEGALKGAATIGITVPLLILALPVCDTFVVIGRRLMQGVPVYQADTQHFHHRMLALGLSQRQVALLAYLFSCSSAGIALLLARTGFDQGWIGWALFFVFAGILWATSRPGILSTTLIKSQRRVIQ